MYGYLKSPMPINCQDLVYKVMIHSTPKEGVFVYHYTSRDALFSSFDSWHPDVAGALEDWNGEVEEWIELDDPLPDCQHDCTLPVRVKGRDRGVPQWGQYEILEDGEWREFTP